MELRKLNRVLFAVLNWGLGHATRSAPLIRFLLDKGVEVEIASNGISLAYLKNEFTDIKTHRISGYNVRYSTRKSLMPFYLLCQIPKIKRAIDNEQREIQEITSDKKFDLILSDNRYGVHSSSIKSIIITHQLRLSAPYVYQWVNIIIERYLSKFDSIFIPDHHVIQKRISGHLSDTSLPHHFIGPISSLDVISYNNTEKDIDYLIVLSGVEPTRTQLEISIIKATRSSNKKIVLVRGTEQPFTQPTELETYNLLQRKELEALIYRSKILVARSGYSTLMDLEFLRMPAILIPTPGQTEQEQLASLLHRKQHYLVLQQKNLSQSMFNWSPEMPIPVYKKSPSETFQQAFESALNSEGFIIPT